MRKCMETSYLGDLFVLTRCDVISSAVASPFPLDIMSCCRKTLTCMTPSPPSSPLSSVSEGIYLDIVTYMIWYSVLLILYCTNSHSTLFSICGFVSCCLFLLSSCHSSGLGLLTLSLISICLSALLLLSGPFSSSSVSCICWYCTEVVKLLLSLCLDLSFTFFSSCNCLPLPFSAILDCVLRSSFWVQSLKPSSSSTAVALLGLNSLS